LAVRNRPLAIDKPMRHLTLLLITAFLVLTAEATYCELTAEWRLLAEEDNIRVLKKVEVDGRETPFKAEAEIDASVEQVLNIILDFERKPEWSPKCEKVTMIRKDSDFDYFVKEKYLTPWPVRDREFFLLGEIIINRDGVIITARSDDPQGMADPECITAEVYELDIILNRLPDNRTEMVFIFQGDLKGWLPKWLNDLIEEAWPLQFMQGLRAQLKKEDINWCPRYKAIAHKFSSKGRGNHELSHLSSHLQEVSARSSMAKVSK
jgi:hypothetical protein